MKFAPDAQPAPQATARVRVRRKPPRRRRGPPGDLRNLQRELWDALKRCGDILDDPATDADTRLRAVNALATAGNTYLRCLDQVDLARDVAALRADLDLVKAAHASDHARAP